MKNLKKKFFSGKNLTAEKTERGNPLGLSNIHSVAEHQKNAGDPLGKKSEKKSHSAEKKIERGDPLVPSGLVGNV